MHPLEDNRDYLRKFSGSMDLYDEWHIVSYLRFGTSLEIFCSLIDFRATIDELFVDGMKYLLME